ncbi:protein Bim1p [Trichomonascus vanleenenianus]|uniref:microtubule-binding protein BIM1 n=1 Tax=Trichomonascus vanleenenianus TaxID=2268995 RepID=UPI003ECB5147
MAESRQELVNWVNELLLLNVSKVEQCGNGAIFCQIYDSIFLDVPMHKVKFDANTEYDYFNNFKVLQLVFNRHKIDRAIPMDKLVKCRMQDNLEFLQWTRRFWDQHFPEHEYDPVSRRKSPVAPNLMGGSARPASRTVAASTRPVITSSRNGTAPSRSSGAPVRAAGSGVAGAARPMSAQRVTSGTGAGNSAALNAARDKIEELKTENEELAQAVELVESERDFYFQKLRDIEVLIQTAAEQLDSEPKESEAEKDKSHSQLIREIQTILYSTAEGFEIPTQEFETEETF